MTQAIETNYKGYKFRSRLEARWAVFFDALNELYMYESEGFKLKAVLAKDPSNSILRWKKAVDGLHTGKGRNYIPHHEEYQTIQHLRPKEK